MMLWFIILLMIGGTVAALLWPLMRPQIEKSERRAVKIAVFVVLIWLAAGAMIFYVDIGAPELVSKTQPETPAETGDSLAAEAAAATRAVQANPGVETYDHLGNILFRMGNYDAATKAYEAATRFGNAGQSQNNDKSN